MLLKINLQNMKGVKAGSVMCVWNKSFKRCKAVKHKNAMSVTLEELCWMQYAEKGAKNSEVGSCQTCLRWDNLSFCFFSPPSLCVGISCFATAQN